MKKILSLVLALALCASLAACGGKEPAKSDPAPAPAESTPSAAPAPAEPEPAPEPESDGGPTDEQRQALADAYNQVVDVYNEVLDNAEANGWMADEATAAEIEVLGATVEPVGTALSEDMSMLEGADFDALPGILTGEILPELQKLNEKVSVPYETADGGDAEAEPASGAPVVTDEALVPLANAYNELANIYNEVYPVAEANGWLADEQTATELNVMNGMLLDFGAGLAGEPSSLDGVEDMDALVEQFQNLVPELEKIGERVSVPYGG